jgi:hypothetical protein
MTYSSKKKEREKEREGDIIFFRVKHTEMDTM